LRQSQPSPRHAPSNPAHETTPAPGAPNLLQPKPPNKSSSTPPPASPPSAPAPQAMALAHPQSQTVRLPHSDRSSLHPARLRSVISTGGGAFAAVVERPLHFVRSFRHLYVHLCPSDAMLRIPTQSNRNPIPRIDRRNHQRQID